MYRNVNRQSNNTRSRRNRGKRARANIVANRRTDGRSYNNTSSRPRFFQAPSSLIFRGIGIPDRFETTLIFKADGVHFSGSIEPAAQAYATNSCFDPDITGGGTQPNYWDQFTAMYSEYFVKEFWAEVDINNQSTTITAQYTLMLSDTNVTALNTETLAESKYAISGMIGPTGSVSTKKVRMPVITTAHLFGQPIPESDSTLFAPTSASPTDLGYFIFRAKATDSASSINIYCNFKLFYRVIFKSAILPTES